jgi:hypothetical protein
LLERFIEESAFRGLKFTSDVLVAYSGDLSKKGCTVPIFLSCRLLPGQVHHRTDKIDLEFEINLLEG